MVFAGAIAGEISPRPCNKRHQGDVRQGKMQEPNGDREARWASLLRTAIAGDGVAYARFLREITPVLRGIVRARGRSLPPDQHEDIVQEVLMSIHAKRHTWRPDHPVQPWLYAITRHKVIDAFRRRGSAVILPVEGLEDELQAEPAPDGLAARDVEHFLGQLDPRSAEIVRAIALREESHDAVGARLGIGGVALRVGLHRAMKRLQALGRDKS
jgi:RNA polymerase sigma factor (sigma-70 family)